MNPRILKESRGLLPAFGITLLASILPAMLWPGTDAGIMPFAVCSTLMAASSIGNEFSTRTLPLLLVQPVARRTIWTEKMRVLGTAMALGFVTLLMGLKAPDHFFPWILALALIPLFAFCATPYWTLMVRNTLLGTVLAFAAPIAISGLLSLLVWVCGLGPFLERNPYPLIAIPAILYCALFYRAGYREFMKIQWIESQAVEISLPARLESAVARLSAKFLPGYTGPLTSLLMKELRLQQATFLCAGVFCGVALLGALIYSCDIAVGEERMNLGTPVLVGDFCIYILLIPFLAGALGVAEEKTLGVAAWQMTLPPSVRKQWSIKTIVVLSTSLTLGLILPTLFALAGKLVFYGAPDAGPSPPPTWIVPLMALCVVLAQLLLTSVVIYAAAFSNSALGAILLALCMLLFGGLSMWIGGIVFPHQNFEFLSVSVHPFAVEGVATQRRHLCLLALGMLVFLPLLHRLAYVRHRSCGLTGLQITMQAALLMSVVSFLSVLFLSLEPV